MPVDFDDGSFALDRSQRQAIRAPPQARQLAEAFKTLATHALPIPSFRSLHTPRLFAPTYYIANTVQHVSFSSTLSQILMLFLLLLAFATIEFTEHFISTSRSQASIMHVLCN
jgi:hypothetical protein